jgi:hypothetical protein
MKFSMPCHCGEALLSRVVVCMIDSGAPEAVFVLFSDIIVVHEETSFSAVQDIAPSRRPQMWPDSPIQSSCGDARNWTTIHCFVGSQSHAWNCFTKISV